MWIRAAFWTGQPRSGENDAFTEAIDVELASALKRLPGVMDVKVLWARRREDGAPDLYCQVQVYFKSLFDVEQMLNSPERAALRPRIKEVAGLFDGALSHIDYEVG